MNGQLTLADVVAFLPGHQRDHAEQLVRLAPPYRNDRSPNRRPRASG